MAENVEEKIVAAKFDSSDFEKGVNKTVKKLDELKKNLNFEKTGETVAELSKKTKEATESMGNNMEKLTERITSFTGIMKQKLLSRLADEVVGTLFKVRDSIFGFFNNMTFGQISSGLSKYESALTSVRMITNAFYTDLKTNKKINYGESEVYQSIEHLQRYADETSYSMDQMSDAMSKMVAAGVRLEDAEKNVQGIANACAAAGINAQDASRAFFNLSQAYSSGGLKYTDYRSLELLNMTNENFVDSLIAAAEAAGTLKKVKDGIWKTQKSESNKKVTAGKQVTKKNITESLRYNFADNDVMDILFGQNYYVDVADFLAVKELTDNTEERIQKLLEMTSMDKLVDKEIKDVIKNLDSKDERKKRYLEYGKDKKDKSKQTAYLKELKNDTELVTKAENAGLEKIVKSLDDASQIKKNYYAKSNQKERDEYLQSIKEEAEIVDKLPKKYNKIQVASFMAGREARNFNDVIQAIGEYVSSKFSKVFERMFGTLEIAKDFFTDLSEFGIAEIFTGIADWIDEVSEFWDTGNNQVVSGGALFRDAIKDVGGAIAELAGIIGDVFPSTQDFGELLYGLTMEFRRGAGDIRSWLAELRAWFNTKASAEETMTRMQKLQTILANLSGSFTIIGNVLGIAIGAIDRGLRLVSPIFEEVLDGLIGATQPISDLSNNSEAFDDLSNSITNVFVILEPLVDLLTPFISKLGEIIGIVSGFFIGGSISVITTNIDLIASTVRLLIDLFGTKEMKEAAAGGSTLEAIANDIKGIGDACKEAFTAVKDFFTALIGDVRELFGLPREAGEAASKDNQNSGGLFSGIQNFFETNEFIKKAEAWFEQAKKDIRDWIIHLPEKVNEFIHNLLYRKVAVKNENKNGKSFDAEGQQGTIDYIETPLKRWFDGTVANVKKFFDDFPQNFTKAINEIGSIWTKVKEALSSLFYTKVVNKNENKNGKSFDVEGQQGTIDYIDTPLKIWFDGVVAKVKTFIENIPQNFTNSVGSIWKQIKDAIASLFTEKVNSEGGGKKFDIEGQGMSEYVEIPLTKWITNLTKSINSKRKEVQKSLFSGIKKWFDKEENIKVVRDFIQSIVDAVKQFVLDLPKKIIETIKNIGSVGRTIVSVIKDIFKPSDVAEGTQKQLEEGVEQINLTWLFESIKNIGIEIANQFASLFTGTDDIEANIAWFNETVMSFIKEIPGKIWGAFRWVSEKFGEYWDKLFIWITGGNDTNPDGSKRTSAVLAKLNEIFPKDGEGSIGDYIRGIPGLIQAAFKDAGEAIGALWDGLMDALNGKKQIKEPTEAEKKINAMAGDPRFFGKSKWQQLAEDISSAVIDVFNQLPQLISDGLDDAIIAISSALDSVTQLMGEALAGETEEPSVAVAKVLEPSPNKEESALTKSLKSLGSHLIKLITEHIPTFITTGFTLIKEKASDWWATLSDAFNTFSTDTEVQKKIEDIGTKIATWIEDLPKRIRAAIASFRLTIEKLFGKKHNGGPTFTSLSEEALGDNNDVKKAFDAVGEGITKESDDSTIWGSIKNVGTKIGDAFKTVFDNLGPDIENFVKDIPTHLVNGLNWAVGGIDSALKWVIDQLTSSENDKKDSEQQMKDLEKDAKDKAEEAAKTAAEGASESKGVFNDSFAVALGGLFTTVKTVITETLPTAIIAGFDAIKKNAGGWLEALKNIFVGTEGLDETEVNTDGLIGRIKVALEALPKKITDLWENAKILIKRGLKSPKQRDQEVLDAYLNSDATQSEKDYVKKYFQKYSHAFEEGAKESSLFDDIMAVGTTVSTTLTDAFKTIGPPIGEAILNGWNTALSAVNSIFSGITNWIKGGSEPEKLGDEIEKVTDTSLGDGFKETLGNIGKTIENFFSQTLPDFLGNGIGKLIADLPGLITRIFDSAKTAYNNEVDKLAKEANMTEEEKKKSFITNPIAWIETFVNNFSGIFDFLKNLFVDDQGKMKWTGWVIIAIGAIILIIHSVRKFNKECKEAGEDFYEDKNGIGGILRALINFMSLSLILAGVCSQMNTDQFNKVKEILGILQGILDRILPLLYTITILKYGPKAIESLGDFFGVFFSMFSQNYRKAHQQQTVFNLAGNDLEAMGESYGKLVEQATNLNKQMTEAKQQAHGLNMNEGFEGLIGKFLKGASTGANILEVGAAGTAVFDLFGNSLNNVLGDLFGNAGLMGSVINSLSSSIGSAVADVDEKLKKIENAITLVGKVVELANTVIELGQKKSAVQESIGVLDSISESLIYLTAPFKDATYINTFNTGLSNLIGMKGKMTDFANWVNSGMLFDDFKMAIASLGTVLSFFDIGNVSGLDQITDEWIAQAAAILVKMLENDDLMKAAKKLTPDLFGSSPGQFSTSVEMLILYATSLSKMAEGVKGFTAESGESMSAFFNALNKITVKNDNQNNISLSKSLMSLAEGLKEFTEGVNTITIDDDKLKYAMEILDKVASLADTLDEVGNGVLVKILAGGTSLQTFASQFGYLGESLQNFMNHMHPTDIKDTEGNILEEMKEWNFTYIYDAMYVIDKLTGALTKLNMANVNAALKLFETDKGGVVKVAAGIKNLINEFNTGETFDVSTALSAFTTFDTLTKAIGELQYTNVSATLQALNKGFYYDTTKDNSGWNYNTYDDSLFKFILNLKVMYERITGWTIKPTAEINISKVKEFFSGISGFFHDIGQLTYNIYGKQSATEVLQTAISSVELLTEKADSLYKFVDMLAAYDTSEQADKLDKAQKVMTILRDMAYVLSTGLLGNFNGISLYGSTGQLEDFEYDRLASAIQQVLEGIGTALETAKNISILHSSGRSMAGQLFKGMEEAFQDPSENLQPHITPILNLDTARSQLSEFFGLADPETFNITSALTDSVQSAFSLLNQEEQPNYTELLTNIDEKVATVGEKLDNIPDAVSKMKVYLDTGVLVGEMAGPMDRALALFGDQYARQVAISFGSPMNIMP